MRLLSARQKTRVVVVGTAIGAGAGALAGVMTAVALQTAVSVPFGLSVTIAINALIVGGVLGGAISYGWASRLPEMLDHYREEHLKLRQTARKLRAALKSMGWTPGSLEQLDRVVETDAALRHQATVLTKLIAGFANVNWKDKILAGKEMMREYIQSSRTKRMTMTDLTVNAYRSRLSREVEELATARHAAPDSAARAVADGAYKSKYEELVNFTRCDETVGRIENELTRIRVKIESALLQTARFATASASVQTDLGFADEFLTSLQTDLNAFDEALAELLHSSDSQAAWERLAQAAPRADTTTESNELRQ